MKRNISKYQEKLKKLEKLMKEAKRDFYVEFGKEIEKEIVNGNVDGKVKEVYELTKQKYGV